VKRLERRGHAERIDNPADGRSYLVRLTPEGRSLLNKARPRFRSYPRRSKPGSAHRPRAERRADDADDVGQGPLAVAEVANSTDGELWRVRP
jgi:DNA-binding MarR family transcriptional regulator